VPHSAIYILGLLAVLFCAFLWLRRRRRPMRSAEEAIATTWLGVRRLVMLGCCLLLVLGALHNVSLAFALQDVRHVGYALLGVLLALAAYQVGRYGRARKGSTAAEDMRVHGKRMKKYGWRW